MEVIIGKRNKRRIYGITGIRREWIFEVSVYHRWQYSSLRIFTTVLFVKQFYRVADKTYKASSPHPAQKSRLQEFKQMSVETFAMLRQKINDSRRPNLDRPRSG